MKLPRPLPLAFALATLYGGSAQAPYPWRGRITCNPAPGRPGTPDKTGTAATQVSAFVGTAARGRDGLDAAGHGRAAAGDPANHLRSRRG